MYRYEKKPAEPSNMLELVTWSSVNPIAKMSCRASGTKPISARNLYTIPNSVHDLQGLLSIRRTLRTPGDCRRHSANPRKTHEPPETRRLPQKRRGLPEIRRNTVSLRKPAGCRRKLAKRHFAVLITGTPYARGLIMEAPYARGAKEGPGIGSGSRGGTGIGSGSQAGTGIGSGSGV